MILVVLASGADAQVLEIQADGAVILHDGPAVYTREGVVSIEAPPSGGAPTLPTSPMALVAEVELAAQRHGVAPDLLKAVAWRESGFQPDARSPKGAFGIMQLTEAAALEVGVDRFDVTDNIRGGAAYLRRMIDTFGGDLTLGLAAYNAGPGAVRRYGGVPPYRETQAYVSAILARLAKTPNISPSRTIP